MECWDVEDLLNDGKSSIQSKNRNKESEILNFLKKS